jgi:hypothetical protein
MQRPFLSTAAIGLFALIGAACASDAANRRPERPPTHLRPGTRK